MASSGDIISAVGVVASFLIAAVGAILTYVQYQAGQAAERHRNKRIALDRRISKLQCASEFLRRYNSDERLRDTQRMIKQDPWYQSAPVVPVPAFLPQLIIARQPPTFTLDFGMVRSYFSNTFTRDYGSKGFDLSAHIHFTCLSA